MGIDKKFYKIGMSMILGVLLIGIASAMDCDYDSEPYLTEDIEWLCSLDYVNSRCYGLIYDHDNLTDDSLNLISVSPETTFIKEIGVIDNFISNNGLVNIKFNKNDLYEGIEYNFTVKCVNETNQEQFSRVVTPYYATLRQAPHQASWVVENTNYIIALVIILVLTFAVLFFLKRRAGP